MAEPEPLIGRPATEEIATDQIGKLTRQPSGPTKRLGAASDNRWRAVRNAEPCSSCGTIRANTAPTSATTAVPCWFFETQNVISQETDIELKPKSEAIQPDRIGKIASLAPNSFTVVVLTGGAAGAGIVETYGGGGPLTRLICQRPRGS